MENNPKELKCGTIESFFSSQTTKKQKSVVSLSLGEQQDPISSYSSTNKQQEQIHSSSSESSLLLSSSSNTQVSNITDISRSVGELPAKPIRPSCPSNKDKRSFRSQWYSHFTWLEYSELTDSAYCYYCRHFSTETILNNRYKYITVIDKSRNELVKRNHEKLIKIVSTLHLCGRQVVAIRGHEKGESSLSQGNFIELLHWTSSADPVALSILKDSDRNTTYLSPQELADDGTERSTYARAKSLDFSTAHNFISAVSNQISELRNEEEFSKLYDQIIEFSGENNIDLNNKMKERRTRKTSTRFKNCLITCTIEQREEIDNKNKYRIFAFYPVIDSILVEINDRFSKTNMDILRGVSSLSPDSSTFLEIDELKVLCVMLKSDIQLLNNEIQVRKPMLKQLKPKNMIDLYFEILPFGQAFPRILSLLIGAMAIPVSSTTTERASSKMKLIKTVARNSMSDSMLIDLLLRAIEREFCVDYEKLIDAFDIQHNNSRIILNESISEEPNQKMAARIQQPLPLGKGQQQQNNAVPARVVPKLPLEYFQKNPFFAFPSSYHRDYYICTDCGAYSCGGVYSSRCRKCHGVASDPPRESRRDYLCIECARRYEPCSCDPTVIVMHHELIYRNPPEYCWYVYYLSHAVIVLASVAQIKSVVKRAFVSGHGVHAHAQDHSHERRSSIDKLLLSWTMYNIQLRVRYEYFENILISC
ncbi:unnamed protein product [Rotaria socialis]|uniref:Uncharacterized protein n=2 Tax=Rotaria socialis TaxID=392032 RepID=A0A821I850_9BILA|nr:unnamed protein product [Rotaria socialis]